MASNVVLRYVKPEIVDKFLELNTRNISDLEVTINESVYKSMQDGLTYLLETNMHRSDFPNNFLAFFMCYGCILRHSLAIKRYCYLHRQRDNCHSTEEYQLGVDFQNSLLIFEAVDFSKTGVFNICAAKFKKPSNCQCFGSTFDERKLGKLFYIKIEEAEDAFELKHFIPKKPISICKGSQNGVGFLCIQNCGKSRCPMNCSQIFF